jgi:hypothetical protein
MNGAKGITCGSTIVVTYPCALSARPGITTSYVRGSNDMPPQTRTDPPPNCTVPTILLHGAYLSPGRLYTL